MTLMGFFFISTPNNSEQFCLLEEDQNDFLIFLSIFFLFRAVTLSWSVITIANSFSNCTNDTKSLNVDPWITLNRHGGQIQAVASSLT